MKRVISMRRIFFLIISIFILSVASTSMAQDSATPPDYYPPASSQKLMQSLVPLNVDGYQVLLIEDYYPWDSSSNRDLLMANGISFKEIFISEIPDEIANFKNYKKIIIAGDQPTYFYNTYMFYKSYFDSYVEKGGVLEWHLCGYGWNNGDIAGVVLPGGVRAIGFGIYEDYNDVAATGHPLVNGVPSIFYGNYASHGYFIVDSSKLDGMEIITTQDEELGYYPTLITYNYGKGFVIASTQPLEYRSAWQATQTIHSNLIPYFGPPKKNELPGNSGQVLFIDGMNLAKTINPDLPLPYTNYLYNAVPQNWVDAINSKVGTLTPFDWDGNLMNDGAYIQLLSATLEMYTNRCKINRSPLVVVAHSWGSVMAYIAMSINSNIKVSKFITLGSPLFAQNPDIKDVTDVAIAEYFIDRTSPLKTVKIWRNYWTGCDAVSGSIPIKKVSNVVVQPVWDCHSAYYDDSAIWDLIMMDIYTTKK